MVRASPPVYVQVALTGLSNAALERDNVAGIELLLLNETAPPLGHHVALAAVPVGVPEPPRLAVPVLEVQQQPLLVRRRIQRKVPLRVLLRNHQPVQLPHVARRHHFVEHVLPLRRTLSASSAAAQPNRPMITNLVASTSQLVAVAGGTAFQRKVVRQLKIIASVVAVAAAAVVVARR